MRVRLSGIKEVRKVLADGSVRIYRYHRRTMAPVVGEPGSDEFVQSLAEAVKPRVLETGTVKGLIAAYKASSEYGKRAAKTRKDYDRYLTLIESEFGGVPIESLNDRETRGHFFDWRDRTFGHSPRSADYAITVAARLLSWGLDRGKLDVNRLAKAAKLYEVDRSEIIWTPAKLEAFDAASYPELQDALRFSIYTLQREADCVRFGPAHVKGGRFRIRQGKTKAVAAGPVLGPIQAIIDRSRGRMTYLVSRNGQPWKLDHLRHEMRRACMAADLPGMHYHDARGTGITMAVAAKWDAGELALMSGLELTEASRIIERYFARGAFEATWEPGENDFGQLPRKPAAPKTA